MYIETSLPRKLGDYAILQSHWLSLTGTNCVLSLFYHMEVRCDFNAAYIYFFRLRSLKSFKKLFISDLGFGANIAQQKPIAGTKSGSTSS